MARTAPVTARQPRTERLRFDADGRVDIKSLSLPELSVWVHDELGGDEGLALRLYKQLWQLGATRFEHMHTVAKRWHAGLSELAYISFLEPHQVLASVDGTQKFVWRLRDGLKVESVLIPDGDRVTLCMSSQVGCAMACTFCLTGDMGLTRQLSASEIANQPLQIGRQFHAQTGRRITNLVLMGMGEPLHNLPNLVPALEICLEDHGLNFSHRRVTVSTVGLVSKLRDLAEALPVNLAVSLNASTQDQRLQIMPIAKRHSLSELLEACRTFPLPAGKRITMEYVMLGGFNDSLDDADRLLVLLADLPVKVNLIPYNDNPHRQIERPSDERVRAFQHRLVSNGLSCTVRTTRGTDISAACGQLGEGAERALSAARLQRARVIAGLS